MSTRVFLIETKGSGEWRETERARGRGIERRWGEEDINFLSFPKANRVSTCWTPVNNDLAREVHRRKTPHLETPGKIAENCLQSQLLFRGGQVGGQQVTDILQLWVHPPAPPSQQGWCFSKREDSCCVSFLPGLEFSPSQQEPSALGGQPRFTK